MTVDSLQELNEAAGFLNLRLVFISNEKAAGILNSSQQDIPEEGEYQIYEIGSGAASPIGRNCTVELRELIFADG